MKLAYRYGCLEPVEGLDHALAEHERCTMMWDQLIALDRAHEDDLRELASADEPEICAIDREIKTLSERLAEDADDTAARSARRDAFRRRNQLHAHWRRENRDVVREAETRRIEAVTAARKATEAWWPNYNRVIESYNSGRQSARQKGRQLREHDESRDDGVLAVQIPRTASGLGADMGEITGGQVGALNIHGTGRRRELSMRVDSAGNRVRLPLIWHRDPPTGTRVKAVRLTWRRHGARTEWSLSMQLDMPDDAFVSGSLAVIELGWHANAGLEVMRVGDRVWRLPPKWIERMDLVQRQEAELKQCLEHARAAWGHHRVAGPILALPRWRDRIEQLALQKPKLPEQIVQWWVQARRLWLAIPGTRRNALRHRRELYRQWAREIVRDYPVVQVSDDDFSAAAREDRGEAENALRHRAAVHTLRAEIIHQGRKAGTPVYSASGALLSGSGDAKSSAWSRRKAAKQERSQNGEIEQENQSVTA